MVMRILKKWDLFSDDLAMTSPVNEFSYKNFLEGLILK